MYRKIKFFNFFSFIFLFFFYFLRFRFFELKSFQILRFAGRRMLFLFDLLSNRVLLVPPVSQTSNATSSTKKVLLILIGIILTVSCEGGTKLVSILLCVILAKEDLLLIV